MLQSSRKISTVLKTVISRHRKYTNFQTIAIVIFDNTGTELQNKQFLSQVHGHSRRRLLLQPYSQKWRQLWHPSFQYSPQVSGHSQNPRETPHSPSVLSSISKTAENFTVSRNRIVPRNERNYDQKVSLCPEKMPTNAGMLLFSSTRLSHMSDQNPLPLQ